MGTRIEDSLEAIDQLEEQLESFGEVTKIERVMSPDLRLPDPTSVRQHSPAEPAKATKKSTSAAAGITPGKKEPGAKSSAGSTRFNTLNPSSLSVSKRVAMQLGDDEKKAKQPMRRASLARINSLSEPKNRSPKQAHSATRPTGASAARKSRDEADMVDKKVIEKSGRATGVPGRVRSAKPPTRPHFELPGDAISKKRREEREAKLRAQEEEEKKKREFKARPVRSSSVRTGTYPKETAASRARQANRAAVAENRQAGAQAETTPNKRLSVATRTPLSNGTSSSVSPRGRSSMTGSSPTIQTSRATSTSTGSVSGKRSTVSAEDQQQMKLRGKELYARDNRYFEDRGRERREREHAARIARQEAAERSRQASRGWAEKQRQKRLATSTSATGPVARIVVS